MLCVAQLVWGAWCCKQLTGGTPSPLQREERSETLLKTALVNNLPKTFCAMNACQNKWCLVQFHLKQFVYNVVKLFAAKLYLIKLIFDRCHVKWCGHFTGNGTSSFYFSISKAKYKTNVAALFLYYTIFGHYVKKKKKQF